MPLLAGRETTCARRGSAAPRTRRRARTRCGVGQSWSTPSPSRTTKISSSAECRCGGAPSSPSSRLHPVQPGQLRAGGAGERLDATARVALELVEVDDARRTRRPSSGSSGSPAATSRAHGWSPVPTSAQVPPIQPTPARGRCPTSVCAARAEREHVEALVAGAQAVRLTSPVHDAVAGAHLEGGAVEQADPRAAEDEEDLLLGRLAVEGRRPLARIDPDPVQADRLRPGRGAEVRSTRRRCGRPRADRSRSRPSGRSHADYPVPVPARRTLPPSCVWLVVAVALVRRDPLPPRFPAAAGSSSRSSAATQWTFENLQYGGEETIAVTRADGGVFRLEGFPGAPSLRVRWLGADAPGMGHGRTAAGRRCFRFGAPAGTTYAVDLAAAALERRAGDGRLAACDRLEPRAAPDVPGHDPVHPAAGSRSGRRGPDRPLVRPGRRARPLGRAVDRRPGRARPHARRELTQANPRFATIPAVCGAISARTGKGGAVGPDTQGGKQGCRSSREVGWSSWPLRSGSCSYRARCRRRTAANASPLEVARAYLDKSAGTLGVGSADVEDMFVTSSYRSTHTGVTHVNLNQRLQELEVFGGHVTVNVARDGGIVFAGGSPVELSSASGTARLSATDAVRAAAAGAQPRPTHRPAGDQRERRAGARDGRLGRRDLRRGRSRSGSAGSRPRAASGSPGGS